MTQGRWEHTGQTAIARFTQVAVTFIPTFS